MGRAALALRPCWRLRAALVRMNDIVARVNGCGWRGVGRYCAAGARRLETFESAAAVAGSWKLLRRSKVCASSGDVTLHHRSSALDLRRCLMGFALLRLLELGATVHVAVAMINA